MTCQEALRLLYEVIDKEASQIDTEKVKEHLKSCEHCLERYEFEAMFRVFVTEKAVSACKTEHLKSRIMKHLEVAEKPPRGFFSDPWKNKLLLFSAAASLIVIIVIALMASQYYRHRIMTYPYERYYLSSATDRGDNNNNLDSMPTIRLYLADSLHVVFNNNIPGFSLRRCGYSELRGHRFVHLDFINGASRASLFIGDSDNVNLPDFERGNFAGTDYFRHICFRCQVIYWRPGNMLVVAVSDDKNLELPELINAVQPI
jgi:anti-sigma factor (TIGR02949 family)